VIVDTHVHSSELWYEPIETIMYQMQANKVDKSILIPYSGNYLSESYEIQCTLKYPGKFGAVVQVDAKKPDALDTLEMLAQQGAVGVRLRPQSDPIAVWRKANKLGLIVSSNGTIDTYAKDGFKKMVEELPNLKIVLEHLGGGSKTKTCPEPNYQLFDEVLLLANYPNIYIKLPGFGELLPRPRPMKNPTFDNPPTQFKMVYEAFGPQRMMWGSDFPPSAEREGYANALRYPMEEVDYFTKEDKEWIFGKTAISVFKI
jgi:L-fuconolactonase